MKTETELRQQWDKLEKQPNAWPGILYVMLCDYGKFNPLGSSLLTNVQLLLSNNITRPHVITVNKVLEGHTENGVLNRGAISKWPYEFILPRLWDALISDDKPVEPKSELGIIFKILYEKRHISKFEYEQFLQLGNGTSGAIFMDNPFPKGSKEFRGEYRAFSIDHFIHKITKGNKAIDLRNQNIGDNLPSLFLKIISAISKSYGYPAYYNINNNNSRKYPVPEVEVLIFSRNFLDDFGQTVLVVLSHYFPNLKDLDLSYNNLKEFGYIDPKKCPWDRDINLSLTSLDLSNNLLQFDGLSYFLTRLKTNTTLVSLDLANNILGDQTADLLIDVLKTNKTLTHVDLRGNPISEDKLSVINQRLSANVAQKASERDIKRVARWLFLGSKDSKSIMNELPPEICEHVAVQARNENVHTEDQASKLARQEFESWEDAASQAFTPLRIHGSQ